MTSHDDRPEPHPGALQNEAPHSPPVVGPAEAHGARLVAEFDQGWRRPHPHAWDSLLADDVELVSPLLRSGRGHGVWHAEVTRLLALLPDLRGEVTAWSGQGDHLFLEISLRATLAGRPLAVRVVDHLHLDDTGRITRREAFFDSAPLVLTVLGRPRAWARWWRSGLAPGSRRRAWLRHPAGAS